MKNKNFYELDEKEVKKYSKEFSKTRAAKEMSLLIKLSLMMVAIWLIIELIEGLFGSGGLNPVYMLPIVISLTLMIIITYCVIYEICFSRWLKLKYKILN